MGCISGNVGHIIDIAWVILSILCGLYYRYCVGYMGYISGNVGYIIDIAWVIWVILSI